MSSNAKKCAVLAIIALAALLPEFRTLGISADGLLLLANAEGCRTSPYQCSAGVWTNGIGHTRGVSAASAVSERQVAVNLIDDVQRVERGIARCMPLAMPQPVYDATVSFAFNVGVRAACDSTFATLINQQKWTDACNQLLRWIYVDGNPSTGLAQRRRAERAWCLKEEA